MKIHEDSLTLLSSSSANGVALSMNRVAAEMPDDHWLPSQHRYRRRGLSRGDNLVRSDLSDGDVPSNELSEYIGVCAPVHSIDGWSILGRAIHCLLRGDPYSAVHLAYYAEVRAALAILASQGIGIFDDPHCVIDSAGCCKIVEPLDEDKKTLSFHRWIWEVFKWWAEQPRAVRLLRKVIRPDGKPLGEWVGGMNRARFAIEEVGTVWLIQWGIDIGRYEADQFARNDASYWPNTINSWEARTPAEDCQAVSQIWQMLQPSPQARFDELDKHLLRILFTRGYSGATEREEGEEGEEGEEVGQNGISNEVELLLVNMGMGDDAKRLWREFLTDPEPENPMVIEMAGRKSKVPSASRVVEVMSRATMLLRLATGASAALLSEAGIEREHLEFWIRDIGTRRGLWQPQNPPDEMIDLWSDVEDGLDEIDGWMVGDTVSAWEMWASESKELAVLGECERVALWGLGL